ncbi:MAG: hypothetical protein QNL62_23780 [Gammaproteobacteria bacterium]|nr:hypothetical protein [Gammaproteobacteria bacterium]
MIAVEVHEPMRFGRAPRRDDYSQEQLSEEVDEQPITDYEFNQCVSW